MLTRDEIIWAYRYLLGRDPAAEEVMCQSDPGMNQSRLRAMLLESREFAIQQKVIGHFPKWVITEIFGGSCKIWIDLADKYVSFGCLIDNYEPLETAAFRRLLRPGYNVVDLGANVGWFSFLAARSIGHDGSVTAIEPMSPTVDYLRRSVLLNELEDRLTVLGTAVADRSGTASLIWHPASHNPGSARLGGADGDAEAQAVEVRELDVLIGDARVDCIKMDIEGAEGLAFAGAGAVLRENRPFLLCEINPGALRAVSDMSVDDFLGMVRTRGYVSFSLENDGSLKHFSGRPEFDNREVVNVVLAHETRPPE